VGQGGPAERAASGPGAGQVKGRSGPGQEPAALWRRASTILESWVATGLAEILLMAAVAVIFLLVMSHQFAYLKDRARESAIKGKLGTLRAALLIYYGENEGKYPPRLAALAREGKIPAVPREDIPAVQDAGNPGHYGVGALDQPYRAVPGSPAEFKGEGIALWGYVNDPKSKNYGHVFVNCRHRDTKLSAWTSW
jgi:hypothetical protein